MIQRFLALAMAAGVVAVSVGACSDAEDTINAAIDCARICDDWNECHGDAEDVDLTDCTESCQDRADDDAAFRDAVDDCEDCLDDSANQCGVCWELCPVFPVLIAQ